MPRSLWSGSVSFGLVNVPVQLVSAVRDVDVHFHQLHERDGARVEIRRFCSLENVEVPYEQIGHGYELDDGDQVVISDDELAGVAPRKTRTIDIEAFVDLADVDPVYFDHPYFLVPGGESEGARRAYALLVEVLSSTERAALGRFVLRTKEYLAILRVRDGRLALTTMLFHDEVRERKGIHIGTGQKPTRTQLANAVALIEELSVDWDPTRYEDRHRQRLLDVIERKKQGKRIRVPRQDQQPSPAPDLMAVLKRSLEEVKQREAAGADGRSQGALASLTKEELYERAQEQDIPGRSKMSKDELVAAISA